MLILAVISVFYRYVLNSSIAWSEELLRYLMVFISMFGAALALRHDEHIGLTFVYNKFSNKYKRIIDFFRYTILFLFSCILAYEGYKFAITTETTGEILPISMKYPHFIVFLFAILILLITLTKIMDLIFSQDKK